MISRDSPSKLKLQESAGCESGALGVATGERHTPVKAIGYPQCGENKVSFVT